MSEYPDIRVIYRHRPTWTIVQRIACIVAACGGAVWFWPARQCSIICIIIAIVFSLLLASTRTLILLVNEDGLTLIKRPLIRLFGSFDFYPHSDIRYIRYRSDIYPRSGDRGLHEVRYFLDIVTIDSRIINLITNSEFPLPARLGKRIAHALDTPYEEYLDKTQ